MYTDKDSNLISDYFFNYENPYHNPEASVNKSLHQISLQTTTSKCTKFLQWIFGHDRDFNVTKYKSITIGDFNIHMDTKTESDVIIFNDLLDSLNMEKWSNIFDT